jgi:hypothetical protein
MEHKLKTETDIYSSITVIENGINLSIKISNYGNDEIITLTKKELHSFIGLLLHVQAKNK